MMWSSKGKRPSINPIVAKVGGLQSRGVKGEAVVFYCEPLTTKDLEPSGFPDLSGVALAKTEG